MVCPALCRMNDYKVYYWKGMKESMKYLVMFIILTGLLTVVTSSPVPAQDKTNNISKQAPSQAILKKNAVKIDKFKINGAKSVQQGQKEISKSESNSKVKTAQTKKPVKVGQNKISESKSTIKTKVTSEKKAVVPE
jgi:hypothetical protein